VLLRGVNDDEAAGLLGWALREGYQLRFIEQMPLDAQHGWDRTSMITADEVLARLRTVYDLAPVSDPDRGSAPAETWAVLDGPDRAAWIGAEPRVGVVGSVTRPFCGTCDRVRLTADGQLRNCLFSTSESDLRAAPRGGADDAEIARRFVASIAGKLAGHGIDDPGFIQPDRPMSAIGG
jgi:GTP 3',8-cyclase